jgi:Lon protease-like protein
MNPWSAADLYFDVDAFCGVARLFPLPNLVLYPHVMQPLHVFEERYREMLEDALAGDRLIAMALLKPGWEPDYDSRPAISPYACLGKVVTHHRLKDGRYNLLLMGVARIRIVKELQPVRSFRQAKVELLEEGFANDSAQHHAELQSELLAAFQRCLPGGCQAPEQLRELLAQHLPLGMMTDLAAYALPLDVAVKQQLLAECCVDVRAQLLLEHLDKEAAEEPVGAAADVFPPPFSDN